MRNTLFKATLVGAVLAISGVTYAGLNSINPVEIFTESSTGTLAAHGSMRDARNSPDSSSYIGCWESAFSGSPTMALCVALDAQGNFFACQSTEPQQVEVAASLNSASFASFVVAQDGVTCARVEALQYSADL
jgi:hypothetical protein